MSQKLANDPRLLDWLGTTGCRLPDVLGLRTPELARPVIAFTENACKAFELAGFPVRMARVGQRFKMAELAAAQFVTGDPQFRGFRIGPYCTEELPADQLNQIRLLYDGFLNGTVESPFPLEPTAMRLDDLVKYVTPDLRGIYGTLMSAQLVLSWTAFETLAGDLWEAAVNVHPKVLAAMTANQTLAQQDEQEAKRSGINLKQLPMNYLERNDYDVANKMGTILRECRAKFDTLDAMAKTYMMTFPEQQCKAGTRDLWSNSTVRAVSAIRNVIVHRAGIVDLDFIKKRGDHPSVATYSLEEPIKLDGQVNKALLDGLFKCANDLIESVDGWIAANP